MASKKPVPVAILAEGMPYVGAGAGNVGALSLTAYVHVVEADGTGALNSRVTTVQDFLNLVVIPAGGISQAFADGRYLQKLNNLSDIGNAVTARGNLNVYSITQVDALFANYYTKAQVDAAIGAGGSPFPGEATIYKPHVADGVLDNSIQPTWIATVADDTNGVYMRCPVGTSAAQALKFFRLATIVNGGVTGNAAATWTATARLVANTPKATVYNACLVARNPANGTMVFLGISGGQDLHGFYGNGTGGVAVDIGLYHGIANTYPWRRIRVDGTNLYIEVSVDGRNWEIFHGPQALSYYIGGGNIEVGVGILQDNAYPSAFLLQSWKLT